MRITKAAAGRLLILWASLVLVVGAGYLVRKNMYDDTVQALDQVTHTYDVRTLVLELTSILDRMQAAELALRLNDGAGLIDDAAGRYRKARAEYGAILDALRGLTRDSAVQQERIGMLRARIADQLARFDEFQRGEGLLAAPSLATAPGYRIQDITQSILDHEADLMRIRQGTVDHKISQSSWVTMATALMQILLLGAVIWVSERQIGRRARAEIETRRAVARARLIVETVREPIAVVTSDLSCLHSNRAFSDFYGVMGSYRGNLADIEAWRSDAALQQKLRDVSLTERELWDYETTQTCVGSVERQVMVNARPMLLPEFSDSVALLTVSDLTARKHSEAQIIELNHQLAGKVAQVTEVNRELEAFSYSVSHDLRAPLRHLAGFSEKLQTHLDDDADPKLKHYCEVIANSARRMSSLIEDLLSYSRLGRCALRFQPVDMQSLVEEVRANLMEGQDRSITWRIAPLPVIAADASMMRLAWQNLLDNAIKYTSSETKAVVEIGYDEGTEDERVFWIRDNGVGFDMEYIDKLFGVFQRLHKASLFPGTGIGLASVRRIIARHDGRTWAEGAPGQGSTFYFSLPRQGPTS